MSLNNSPNIIHRERWIRREKDKDVKPTTYDFTNYYGKMCKECEYYQYCRTSPDTSPTDNACISFEPIIK